jgi:hypothetical protein
MSETSQELRRSLLLEEALKHPLRRSIVLALRLEGPMAPGEISKSLLGKGTPPNSYAYHCKELHRLGLLKVCSRSSSGGAVARYEIEHDLDGPVVDAAVLDAISEVLAKVPDGLHQWIDKPYIGTISRLVEASGRPI